MQEVNLWKICAIKVRRQTTVNLSQHLNNSKIYFTNFIKKKHNFCRAHLLP